MGYGTGAIMAVPAHDQRDFEFADEFDLPDRRASCNRPTAGCASAALDADTPGRRVARGVRRRRRRHELDATTRCRSTGWPRPRPSERIIELARGERRGRGRGHLQAARLAVQPPALLGRAVPDRLRRRRPSRIALPESMLPVELPEITDFEPRILADDDDVAARAAAARAPTTGCTSSSTSATARSAYRRETNTMPQWAGSCWYYLRYLDPTNDERARRSRGRAVLDGRRRRTGGVDLYVGGAEHAVLHLLYARFWHKVLFDLGHVSTPEPFQRLFNQGTSPRPRSPTSAASYVEASEVEERDGVVVPRRRRGHRGTTGKMGKSLKNAVTPDDIYRDYGADTLRLYEMFMGPLDASRPWSTQRHRRRAPVPPAVLAQRGRRGHRRAARHRRRRPTTRPVACCTARSPRSATTWRRSSSTPRSPR